MKKLLANPLALVVTGVVMLAIAAIDMQFVDAGPDNWFRVLHFPGKLAVVIFLLIMAWIMFRWLLAPLFTWIIQKILL